MANLPRDEFVELFAAAETKPVIDGAVTVPETDFGCWIAITSAGLLRIVSSSQLSEIPHESRIATLQWFP